MSNLSVIPKVRVETMRESCTIVISSSVSTALACLKCGQPKGIYSYFGAEKDPVYNRGTCLCLYNAPNPGGETLIRSNFDGHAELIRMEQRQLLAKLWKAPNLGELKASILLASDRDKYSEDFQHVIAKLYECSTLKEAKSIIELYASADEMGGVR